MCTRSARHRHTAYLNQSGRCYYCGMPMWEDSPEAFAKTHRLTLAQALPLRCTAEHLKARMDGGRNSIKNIVAACLHCNQSRHLGNDALDPEAHKRKVQEIRGGIRAIKWRWKRLIPLFLLPARHSLPNP